MGIRAPRLSGTITLTGPMFERDPGRTFAENAADMVRGVVIEGEIDLKARIASIPPAGVRTGRRRKLIRGRVRSAAGKPWKATGVIGIPNAGMSSQEAIETYAAMSAIERLHHPVAQTTRALRNASAVNTAELTKGIG